MFVLNPQSSIPIDRQLISQVRRKIASGQLKPSDALPYGSESSGQSHDGS